MLEVKRLQTQWLEFEERLHCNHVESTVLQMAAIRERFDAVQKAMTAIASRRSGAFATGAMPPPCVAGLLAGTSQLILVIDIKPYRPRCSLAGGGLCPRMISRLLKCPIPRHSPVSIPGADLCG